MGDKYKILLIAPLDLSRTGAGVTHFLQLFSNLIAGGHDIRGICPGYAPAVGNDMGLPIYYVPTFKKSILSYLLFEFLLLFYIPFFIIRFRPDYIYIRHTLNVLVGPFIAALFRIPLALEENGVILREMKDYGSPVFFIKLAKLLRKLQFAVAAKVICVTVGIRDELIRVYGLPVDSLNTVENGVDTELFKPRNMFDARVTTGVPSDKKVIGFVGSFAPWQGLDYLLEGVSLLVKRGREDVSLVVIGDGSLMEQVRFKIKSLSLDDYVDMRGWVDNREVPLFINSFDVCALTRINTNGQTFGSPLKLYEYFGSGKQIVTSGLENLRPLDEFKDMIKVVPEDNAEALADAFEDVLYRNSFILVDGFSEKIHDEYSWNSVSRRTIKILFDN